MDIAFHVLSYSMCESYHVQYEGYHDINMEISVVHQTDYYYIPCESSSQTRSGKIGAWSIIDEQINIQEALQGK